MNSIFNLFKTPPKDLPKFWQAYEAKFEKKLPEQIEATHFIAFDTETTGFDFKKDRILCIGAVGITNNSIEVAHGFEEYIAQDIFNPETVKIHGIIQHERLKMLTEEEAIKAFLKYIENSVLVAHHAQFDIGMINAALHRLGLPNLKNKVLDTANIYRRTLINSNLINKNKAHSLDEVAENFSIEIKDRHTAAGDAFITALAFLKIIGRLNSDKKLKLKKLLRY